MKEMIQTIVENYDMGLISNTEFIAQYLDILCDGKEPYESPDKNVEEILKDRDSLLQPLVDKIMEKIDL